LLPIVVPPPGRFSMTTFWPSRTCIWWAKIRAAPSTGDPGTNGTMILMTLFG
jgi:hypothetical protein